MSSVLIKDTTKEERAKIINGALAISMLDCKTPCSEDMKFYEKYINGKMEIEEIKKEIVTKYTQK